MYKRFIKRGLDIFLSTLGIIILAPFLLLICIFIMIDSKGPIIFTQKRVGKDSTHFNIYKFRTMKVDTPKEIPTHLLDNPNFFITNTGRFLRKTSLDEMPQFINVLRGDMSVVGPRPHMLLIDEFYKAKIGRYSVRSLVKPGITGLAQVSGLRGDTGEMEIEMKKRILADSFYVKNWSLTLDIVIILKTILLVIKGDQKAI